MNAAAPAAGARLRAALDQVAPALGRHAARLWTGAGALDGYRAWLRTVHQLIRATTPLLAEATAEALRRDDPLSARLAPWFAGQVAEEDGHDRWVLEDYAATGADPAEVTAGLPTAAVARFAGAPAYWIRHTHPVALLGHIALLEWYPPAPGTPEALAGRLGLPASAFRTLRAHTALDAEHGTRLREFLDGLTLTPVQHRLLLTAALTSAGTYAEVLAGPAARPPGPRPGP